MKQLFLLLTLFFIGISIPGAWAQVDIKGSEDHPLLSRYPGSYIASYEKIKYREYSLATGPVTGYRQIEKKEQLAGQLYRLTYLIDKDVAELSIGEVYQDYLTAFKKGNIEILASGLHSQRNVKKDVGGSSWISVAMINNGFDQKSYGNYLFKGTASSGGTFAIIGKVNRPEGATYVALYGERHSDAVVVCHVDIIEVKGAEIGKVFADADYIQKEIEEKGTVSIYGINFDFDSAKIKASSEPAIKAIAEYLQGHPKVSLYVVGHTDMKGTLAYNRKLSKDRADALVEALHQQHAISKSRLLPEGLGPLAPRSTNETEEGRALNRRVELVKIINP